MPYFTISSGLRGCYMPDDCYIVRCQTRRELKGVIESEADQFHDHGHIGGSKRDIAHIAAIAWRNRAKHQLPYCLPFAPSHDRSNYAFGVFVSSATRDEWREHCAQE